jgi:Protein of unknown function DUF262/Protein of unknown function (DUF1524)
MSPIDMKSETEGSDCAIGLKPVSALLTDQSGDLAVYRIADYQRGYRWTPQQITLLLDDIWEFLQESGSRSKDAFYCLQPLVIKPDGKRFEVVDGQQRLTTILLILTYFNQRRVEEEREQLYSITFETRTGFDQFLAKPSEEEAGSNVDFFHLYHAMQAIREWFKSRRTYVNDIESALLNRTKVIWFQLADGDHPVDAFTRLNAGKIPLTNDELIRALFLRRSQSDEAEAEATQLRIANEWDLIEKELQRDAFWYFLSNETGATQNRIGFLFKLLAEAEGIAPEAQDGTYAIFYVFNRRLKEGAKPEREWLRVKEEFMRLEEWFEDRVLYHIVGYLVNERVSLGELRKLAQQATKSEFDRKLRRRVFEEVIDSDIPEEFSPDAVRDKVSERLANLEYEGSQQSRQEIRSLLLLFNVATLLQSTRSNMRFQFDSFKNQEWNIEHVRSIASEPPSSHAERQAWLKLCLGYIESQKGKLKLRAEIEAFLALTKQEAAGEDFSAIYRKVLAYFEESEDSDAVHGIANLALLDERTNKSYKNAPFAVKRQRLLELDQAGIFVPLCTRNVFLKCYSPQVDNVIFWSEKDQTAYQNVTLETLAGFFTGNMEDSQ